MSLGCRSPCRRRRYSWRQKVEATWDSLQLAGLGCGGAPRPARCRPQCAGGDLRHRRWRLLCPAAGVGAGGQVTCRLQPGAAERERGQRAERPLSLAHGPGGATVRSCWRCLLCCYRRGSCRVAFGSRGTRAWWRRGSRLRQLALSWATASPRPRAGWGVGEVVLALLALLLPARELPCGLRVQGHTRLAAVRLAAPATGSGLQLQEEYTEGELRRGLSPRLRARRVKRSGAPYNIPI